MELNYAEDFIGVKCPPPIFPRHYISPTQPRSACAFTGRSAHTCYVAMVADELDAAMEDAALRDFLNLAHATTLIAKIGPLTSKLQIWFSAELERSGG